MPKLPPNAHSRIVSPSRSIERLGGFETVAQLEQLSGVSIPKAVDGLQTAEVRHNKVVAIANMQAAVEDYLGLANQ